MISGQSSLHRCAAQAFGPALRNMQYVKRRLRPCAVVAIIGFPLYYYIWHDVFVQTYENLTLRLIGSILFVPIFIHDRWPDFLRRYFPYYWYATTLYAMPFFFTFMLLKNNGSQVWVESALIAAFVMVLLLDWLMLLLQSLIGIGTALLVYWLTTDVSALGTGYFVHFAIFTFAITLGAIANYDLERIRIEQEHAMLATASSIAHELRTPLLTIRTGAAGLAKFLPILLESYTICRRQGAPIQDIRPAHLLSMQGTLARIEQEALHSNGIINMLLINARFTNGFGQPLTCCSISHCIEIALSRYPFRDLERNCIRCNTSYAFDFHGSEILMIHVIFNLLKNALQFFGYVRDFEISIHLSTSQRGNQLIFRDSGAGIAPQAIPDLFTRFHTSLSPKTDGTLGTGIGLAFCRDVMRFFGGTIECLSEQGKYTEFKLTFPPL